jgi:hypothetical protein
MTESDLLMLHIELLNNAWSILFAWIGTTTAMIGAAYFVAARIKISLVIAILSLYGLFTAACATQVFRTWGRILRIGEDLRSLQDSGIALSQSAQVLIANMDSRLVANVALPLMLVVFLASALYVVYCYKGGGAS